MPERPEFVFVPVGAAAEEVCTSLITEFRRKGAMCEMAYRGNTKKRLQRADAAGASYAILVGDDEIAASEITLKSLKSGGQIRRKLSELQMDPRIGRSYFLAALLKGIDGYLGPPE